MVIKLYYFIEFKVSKNYINMLINLKNCVVSGGISSKLDRAFYMYKYDTSATLLRYHMTSLAINKI